MVDEDIVVIGDKLNYERLIPYVTTAYAIR